MKNLIAKYARATLVLYRVAGRTLEREQAFALASEIFKRTGIVVAVEQVQS